jgi:hypothetical protein
MAWWRQGGCAFVNVRLGGGVCAKSPKPSVRRSVLGVPCETTMCGDAGRWWVQVDGIVGAARLPTRGREAGVGPKTRKPSIRDSVSDMPRITAAREDGRGWW